MCVCVWRCSKTAEAVAESLEKSLDLASFEEMDPSLGTLSSVDSHPLYLGPFQQRAESLTPSSSSAVNADVGRGRVRRAAEGHHTFYEREVPFELRSSEGSDAPQEVGALEAIKVKILIHVRPRPRLSTCGLLWVELRGGTTGARSATAPGLCAL